MKFRWIALGTFLLISGSGALFPAEALAKSNPCKSDIRKFCKNKGKTQIPACLAEQDQKNKLSSGCRSYSQKLTARYELLRANCSQEIESFCGGVDRIPASFSGYKSVNSCLKTNSKNPSYSPSCKQVWKKK